MNTMELTKILGAFFGSLLVFLLIRTGVEMIIEGPEGGEEEEHFAYAIEVEEAGEAEAEEEEVAEVDFGALMAAADPAAGEKLYRACAACHKLTEGTNAVGPSLYGIVGRATGAADGYSYSAALAEKGENWTPENLSAFLAAPKEWVPGTKMSYRGMADAEDRANLIAYLDSLDD